jgi:hypothetical protein
MPSRVCGGLSAADSMERSDSKFRRLAWPVNIRHVHIDARRRVGIAAGRSGTEDVYGRATLGSLS